jgi:hypothetical protein
LQAHCLPSGASLGPSLNSTPCKICTALSAELPLPACQPPCQPVCSLASSPLTPPSITALCRWLCNNILTGDEQQKLALPSAWYLIAHSKPVSSSESESPAGDLPASWGSAGAFPALSQLLLQHNQLSGRWQFKRWHKPMCIIQSLFFEPSI